VAGWARLGARRAGLGAALAGAAALRGERGRARRVVGVARVQRVAERGEVVRVQLRGRGGAHARDLRRLPRILLLQRRHLSARAPPRQRISSHGRQARRTALRGRQRALLRSSRRPLQAVHAQRCRRARARSSSIATSKESRAAGRAVGRCENELLARLLAPLIPVALRLAAAPPG